MEHRQLLTGAELAEVLRLRPRTIAAWGAAGRIPRVRCGARSIRYELRQVLAALRADPQHPIQAREEDKDASR